MLTNCVKNSNQFQKYFFGSVHNYSNALHAFHNLTKWLFQDHGNPAYLNIFGGYHQADDRGWKGRQWDGISDEIILAAIFHRWKSRNPEDLALDLKGLTNLGLQVCRELLCSGLWKRRKHCGDIGQQHEGILGIRTCRAEGHGTLLIIWWTDVQRQVIFNQHTDLQNSWL